MNFLLRSSQPTPPDPLPIPEVNKDTKAIAEPSNLVQGAVLDYPSVKSASIEDYKGGDGVGICASGGLGVESLRAKTRMEIEDHTDVSPEEGAIVIPCRELPEEWYDAPDMDSISSFDRSFVFPGEQLHILVYITSHDQEVTEIITPFKVAAVMSKSGFFKQIPTISTFHGEHGSESSSFENNPSDIGKEDGEHEESGKNGATILKDQLHAGGDLSVSESLLKIEGHKKRSAMILENFRNSHFFVRIAGADEPLWSKRSGTDQFPVSSELGEGKSAVDASQMLRMGEKHNSMSTIIEAGEFEPSAAGGVARNAVTCSSLSNGDIVVVLQVTVPTDTTEEAILEVLQFEKYQTSSLSSAIHGVDRSSQLQSTNVQYSHDPCKELLQWLLPLDRPLPPPVTSLSPPPLNSSSFSSSSPQRLSFNATSSSNLFSFGHLRSSSMSSLPQSTSPLVSNIPPSNPSTSFSVEDWDRLSSQKFIKGQEVGSEGLLSFRGASLEPQRFSVHCGLEGLYVPGKRWRRNLQIIQPVEVESYFADCNTEDLICVLIRNVVPEHIADVVIFVDSISIICETTSSGCPPVSVPIACIEAGNDHKLPGLGLRRGEQHSLILKPTTSLWKNSGSDRDKQSAASVQGHPSHLTSNRNTVLRNGDGKKGVVTSDQQESGQYAVLISCRSSHSESRIYFKHSTQWQPRTPRDLLISVASEMSTPAIEPDRSIPQLSAQVLTLQATNLTAEDLNLTVLAPASMASPPSVVSLNSTPSTPCTNSFMSFSEGKGRPGPLDTEDGSTLTLPRLHSISLPSVRQIESVGGPTPLSLKEQNISAADIMADSSSACTHLWVQSTVPLGCVPSHSTTTVRLELLPLTDGIITLDTLQIAAKDRDVIYVPEKALKIYSTSSIASGIV